MQVEVQLPDGSAAAVELDASATLSALKEAVRAAAGGGLRVFVLVDGDGRVLEEEDVQGLSDGDVLRAERGATEEELARVRRPLAGITRGIEHVEMTSLVKPPQTLVDLMAAVLFLAGRCRRMQDVTWNDVKKEVKCRDLLRSLIQCDVADISPKRVDVVAARLDEDAFSPETHRKMLRIGAKLCEWVLAVCALYRVS